jgi:small subunit ribosomal protein S17
MTKTIVVDVERRVAHPKYGKILRKETRLYAHDEREEAKRGDQVEIASTRPLSRLKRWRLLRVVRRAPDRVLPGVAEATAVPGALLEPRERKKEAEPAAATPSEAKP